LKYLNGLSQLRILFLEPFQGPWVRPRIVFDFFVDLLDKDAPFFFK
jgi:hypothetical protein